MHCSSDLLCRLEISRDVDLKRLRTFVAVAELGTVSKAALLLRISQSALSRQISDLEKEFSLRLFDRVGRRLMLTASASSCSEIVAAYWVKSARSVNGRSCFGAETAGCSRWPPRRRRSKVSCRHSCLDMLNAFPTCT
ncbi:MAG TPA: LysR family transcriptional regulator [Reyranella sp.]|nr:LysR family transcriptional regulator [Reyranella sp.]